MVAVIGGKADDVPIFAQLHKSARSKGGRSSPSTRQRRGYIEPERTSHRRIGQRDLGPSASYTNSPLQQYYDGWQPQNAAQVLGLDCGCDPEQAPRTLSKAPPLGCVLPWNDSGPQASLEAWAIAVERENREFQVTLDMSDGYKFWGPVSEAKGKLEFRRLTTVYDSICQRGYRPIGQPNGNIGGTLLSAESNTRIVIIKGHHRIAALAALDYERVPIQIAQPIIRREDSQSWPNVRSCLFTPEQALAVFDRLFEGHQPASCTISALTPP